MSSDEASCENSVASGAVRSLLVSNAPSLLKSTIVRAYVREEAFIEDELDDDYAQPSGKSTLEKRATNG